MKIIIMSGKFGMGHMTTALAIKQQIDYYKLDIDVEIIDWMNYVSPKLAEKYYSLFTLIVNKGSRLYNIRYRFLENKRTNQKPELSTYFKWHFMKLIKQKNPDLIISTIPICSQIVSLYKEKEGSTIPLITCVTDITGHSEWISKNTDIYMVGSPSVKEKFITKGVSPDKIFVTGIPTRLEFIKNVTVRKEKIYNLQKKILIMGGGLGILPVDLEFYDTLDNLTDFEVTIITGKNEKLYHQLTAKYKNIKILGYIHNIYDYMKQSDVVITKPGGVTTFEAINTEVPIIALHPYLQQEIHNAEFIKEMNIGAVIYGYGMNCVDEIIKLLDRDQLDYYRYNIKRVKKLFKDKDLTQLLQKVVPVKALIHDTVMDEPIISMY